MVPCWGEAGGGGGGRGVIGGGTLRRERASTVRQREAIRAGREEQSEGFHGGKQRFG